MNGKQYKNIIDWTVKHNNTAESSNSLETVRAVLKNMGIPLPQGSCKDVFEILKTDNYMGWQSCPIKEAQSYANEGTAAIGISGERIVVLSAEVIDEDVVSDETQAATPAVMTLSDNTSAYAVSDLQYFAYSSGDTNNNGIVINAYFEKSTLSVKVGWSGYNHLYGTRPTTVYWSSTNSNVASVNSSSGKVTAKAEGTATISVYTRSGTLIASYRIIVEGKRVKISKQLDYFTVTFLDTPDPIIANVDLM